jgi:cellobiose phosphorylase
LVPPFDQTDHNPGYIKGYIPGVRENGGQYTHAALWLVRAFAEMGYRERATELIRMLTPIHHSHPKSKADRYRVEPYAVVADIYGEPPLTGMGGWTWYTGSAGWMYRVVLESILGMQLTESKVAFEPHIPDQWNEFEITLILKDEKTAYRISLKTDETLERDAITGLLDGKPMAKGQKVHQVHLKEDGQTHLVELKLGTKD